MKEQQMEEQLWSYIDGTATAAEKKFVEQMLASQEEWKKKYKEQLEIHQLLLTETELEQPSMRFTKNVMDGIAGMQPKAATSTYINKNIIRSIAAFFIISISALLVYSITQINWTADASTTTLLPDMKDVPLPQWNVSKLFTGTTLNIMLMVTIVLSLMLFDGFLRRKKSAA
jgi:anti-sigma factor RsiW